MAAAMTGGEVFLDGARADLLQEALQTLRSTGVEIEEKPTGIRVARNGGGLHAVSVETQPFPGFPTDLQAQLIALMCMAKGTSEVRETIFENRFMHVQELARLGARIDLKGDTALVTGVSGLRGRSGHGDRSARFGVADHRRACRARRDHRSAGSIISTAASSASRRSSANAGPISSGSTS